MAENARTIEQLGEKAKSASESIGKLEDSLKKLDSIIGTISKKFEVGTDNTGKMEDAVKKLTKETETYQKKNFTETLGKVNDVLQELPGGMTDVFEGMKKLSSGTDTNIQDFTTFVGSASGLVTSLSKSVNPAFGIITTVAAGAAGVIADVVRETEEMKKQKFEEDHFGPLTISMEKMKDMANGILSSDTLGKLKTSVSELELASDFKLKVTDSFENVQRTEWKIKVGIQLTPDEIEEYRSQSDSFVENAREWLLQQNYAADMNIDVFIKSKEDQDKMHGYFNDFFSGYQKQVSDLETQLTSTMEKALVDGVISTDESAAIAELHQKIANLTNEASSAEYEASLDSILLRTDGMELTKESYDGFVQQIDTEAQNAIDSYDDQLTVALTNVKMLLNNGTINQDEYAEHVKMLKEGYLENIGEVNLKATQVKTDLLKSTLSDELTTATPEFMKIIKDNMDIVENSSDPTTMFYNVLSDMEDGIALIRNSSPGMADQINEYLQTIQPSKKHLMELRDKALEAGGEIPAGVSEALTQIDMLEALAGDTDALYRVIGAGMHDSPVLQEVIANSGSYGEEVVNGLKEGMKGEEGDFSQMGIDFVFGMLQGTGTTMSECEEKFREIFDKPAEICQETNEIHSPSKRFERSGKNMVDGLLGGLRETWGGLVDWWKNSALGAWWSEHISPWFTWEKWSGLAGGAIDALLSPFRNISWPSLKMPRIEWISGGTQATGFLKTVLNFLHLPTSLPKLKVSWYAKGGIFDSPQIIGVGEHGREAVVPLEHNTQWIDTLARQIRQKQNLNEQEESREALTAAIAPAVSVLAAKLERVIQAVEQVDTTVELDGEKISRSTTKYINNRTRREGKSPILV